MKKSKAGGYAESKSVKFGFGGAFPLLD